MKRQRSRGRTNNRPGMQNPNRAYESVGPDLKVRGSAQTIFERYQQLGRDSMASGDRVLAENYMQHAEHYLRLIKAIQPNFIPRSEFAISGLPSDNDEDGDENENIENENEATENEGGEEQDGEERVRENNNRNENGRYDNNRYNNNNRRNNNNNNRNRDRYRQERPAQENGDNYEKPEIIHANPETIEGTNLEQVSTNRPDENGDDAPRNPRSRGPRLRSLRAPRKPRPRDDENNAPSEGFGEEMPAFLQAPVIIAEAD